MRFFINPTIHGATRCMQLLLTTLLHYKVGLQVTYKLPGIIEQVSISDNHV